MMTWQPSIGQLVSARIVATWLVLVGQFEKLRIAT